MNLIPFSPAAVNVGGHVDANARFRRCTQVAGGREMEGVDRIEHLITDRLLDMRPLLGKLEARSRDSW